VTTEVVDSRVPPAVSLPDERHAPWHTHALQAVGLVLLLLTAVPVYRLLAGRDTGLAGSATVGVADAYYYVHVAGLAVVVLVGILAGMTISTARTDALLKRAAALIARPDAVMFAGLFATVGAVAALAFSLLVLDGAPNHIDSLSQLLHARYWSEGMLAGPQAPHGEFWMIQNSIFTEHGWVSQYPPGHVALLALGLVAGIPAAVGPVLVGVLILTTSLFAERLLPRHTVGVRVGVILLAASPFTIALGGSYMNHVTAAAMLSTAAVLLLRLRCGSAAWGVPAGVALAWSFATRPLTAVVIGSVLLFGICGVSMLRRRPRVVLAIAAGAVPVACALLLYNWYFFGSPVRFGYDVALGPAAGPGFQRDPWGNAYGPLEALGYTSADLVVANVALLEGPLPVLTFLGLFLLAVRRLDGGLVLLFAWALLPVLANAFYWHHGLLMGPRMLYETAPAWLILFGVGIAITMRRVPRRLPLTGSFAPRSALAVATALALLLGAALLSPARLLSYGPGQAHAALPAVPHDALVLVHGSWRGRIAMRLAASGMRLDSVEAVLTLNPTCLGQELADAIAAGDATRRDHLLRSLDFNARGSNLPPMTQLGPGNPIVPGPGLGDGTECAVQAYSDRLGVIDVAPLLWRGTLPGTTGTAPLFLRDLGPALNADVLAAYGSRTPYLLVAEDAGTPTLYPYDRGIELLWRAHEPDDRR
jgi:hypothetical protein